MSLFFVLVSFNGVVCVCVLLSFCMISSVDQASLTAVVLVVILFFSCLSFVVCGGVEREKSCCSLFCWLAY
jgi:hypothetical protein